MFAVRCSDQRWIDKLKAYALMPVALLWMAVAGGPMRLYGTVTAPRQGRVTRRPGVETRTAVDLRGEAKSLDTRVAA